MSITNCTCEQVPCEHSSQAYEGEVSSLADYRLDIFDCPACSVPPLDKTGDPCPFHEGYQRGGDAVIGGLIDLLSDPEHLFEVFAERGRRRRWAKRSEASWTAHPCFCGHGKRHHGISGSEGGQLIYGGCLHPDGCPCDGYREDER